MNLLFIVVEVVSDNQIIEEIVKFKFYCRIIVFLNCF